MSTNEILDNLLNDPRFKDVATKTESQKVNVFSVLKMDDLEIRHSNVLGWFLDPKENHGLGDAFLRAFLKAIDEENKGLFAYQKFDLKKLTSTKQIKCDVIRESLYNIDIFLAFPETKQAIVIENKIWAGQTGEQLTKYFEMLKSHHTYGNYDKCYLYLKPQQSEDEQIHSKWSKVSYREVIIALEQMKSLNASFETRFLLEHYIEILRRNVMKESIETKNKCAEIYNDHKDALDLIFKHTQQGDNEMLSKAVSCFLMGRNDIATQNPILNGVAFITKRLAEIAPEQKKTECFGTGRSLFYTFMATKQDTLTLFCMLGMPNQMTNDFRNKVMDIAESNKDFQFSKVQRQSNSFVQIFKCGFVDKQSTKDINEKIAKVMQGLKTALDVTIPQFENILGQHISL